jgi:hypothetical protein
MKKALVLGVVLASGALMPAAAQDKPAAAPPPSASAMTRPIPLKVQLTISRYQGEKKLSSIPYVLGVLSNSQKTSIRMGIQVPVTQTVFAAKSAGGVADVPQSSYTYRDLGTNIDCQAQPAGDGFYSLTITTEDSSIHLDPSADSAEAKSIRRDIPAFRSFRASFATILRDGQSMQYVSATDPLSGESMRIDVMLTLAK